jgi:hypothetical protein
MSNGSKPRTGFQDRKWWSNVHQSFRHKITRLYDGVRNAETGNFVSDYNAMTSALQKLVREAADEQARLRAFGGTWSFSPVAATDGRLIDTRNLNGVIRVSAASVDPAYPGDAAGLLFVQCGISILDLNKRLQDKGRCLKTSGASNGQTIAGAVSAGTHGSAIDFGAMPDFVVGLHLIVGPGRHVYLERASLPVVKASFADRLGAEHVRDDHLFDAALVSFGSFGLVHGLMIETEPLFLLEAHRKRMPLDAALRRAIGTLDFTDLALPHKPERPYHFQVVINPHNVGGGVYVTSMYKRPHRNDYTPPQPSGGLGAGDDAIAVVGALLSIAPGLTPLLANFLIENNYKEFTEPIVGTRGEIFAYTTSRRKAASMAVGVPLDQAVQALDATLDVHRRHGPFPGVFALRFVQRSGALLGFTRFDPTCVLEIDGPDTGDTREFYRQVWRGLEQAGVPFTFHWGKLHELDAAGVQAMYGDAVDRWLEARRQLLDPALREVFSSPWLAGLGLDA